MCNIVLQLIDQHWLHLWEWMNTSCLMCYRRVHRWFLMLQCYIFHAFSASCVQRFPVYRIGWYYPGLFSIKIECEEISPCWLFLMLSETSFQQNFSQVWKRQVIIFIPIHTFLSYKTSLFHLNSSCTIFYVNFLTYLPLFTVPLTALTPGCRSVKITSNNVVNWLHGRWEGSPPYCSLQVIIDIMELHSCFSVPYDPNFYPKIHKYIQVNKCPSKNFHKFA